MADLTLKNRLSRPSGRKEVYMSKETFFKIREAEAEAERILSEAAAEAERMVAEAEQNGRRLLEETERRVTAELEEMNQKLRQRAEEHTQRALEEGKEEANALSEAVRLTRRSAEKIIIREVEAKCR
jgi:vacuolar-type H+-ATPase subunit H